MRPVTVIRRAAALLLVLVLGAARARAEPVLAVRLGVAQAVGSAVADVSIADTVPLQLPVQLDGLWRLPVSLGQGRGTLDAGAYGSWGPAWVGRCRAGQSCSASVARLGLQALWTFVTAGGAQPWLGVASGYEWAREERSRAGTVTTTYRGFEPLAAQGGIEWRVGRRLALGPYGLLALGRYSRVSLDTGLASATAELPDKAIHAWVHAGVRARLVLGSAP